MARKKVTEPTPEPTPKVEATTAKRDSVTWTPADAEGLKAVRMAFRTSDGKKLSQAAFAELAGISRRRYSYIEYPPFAGSTVKPSKAELERIGKVLSTIQAQTAVS